MLGSRIEELLASEMEANFAAGAAMPDETKQRQLLLEDEEEDFMDEGNIFSPHHIYIGRPHDVINIAAFFA